MPRDSDWVATALGRFTLPPDSIIAELVIMKMISKTRKMSVRGVMLISATMSELSSLLPSGVSAMADALTVHIAENSCDLDAEQGRQTANPGLEVVVKNQRDNRYP